MWAWPIIVAVSFVAVAVLVIFWRMHTGMPFLVPFSRIVVAPLLRMLFFEFVLRLSLVLLLDVV